jgi:hypothetical protein
MVPTLSTSTSALHSDQQLDRENDDDSVGMQSSRAESEELNDPQVKEDENMLLEESSSSSISSGSDVEKSASSSGGEGYSADCSASDQASDQCFDCAARRQKKQVRSTMKAALNRVDLSYDASSSEMESSSQQGEVTDPGTISSASKTEASSSTGTAKKSLSSSLEVKKNCEATISASAAVTAPGLSSSSNRRHLCSNHHCRRSRPRPRARDDSSNDRNALPASDNSHKELANTPMFDTTTQALPQWKGVRISHPMDPRIDISTVGRNAQGQAPAPVLHAATSPVSLPAMTSRNGFTCKNGDTGSTSNTFVATQSPSFDLPSMETYMQLLTVS